MDRLTERVLIGAARRAAEKAYCAYSDFAVGASVLSSQGRIFTGCNIENSSYGLTLCAERNAIFQAVADGDRQIVAVVVYTPTPEPCAPCGSCRQVIREFTEDATVICVCNGAERLRFASRELLINSFGPENVLSAAKLEYIKAERKRLAKLHVKKICIDIDNVVAQTDEVMRRLIGEVTDGRVKLAYEDVKRFDYCKCSDAFGESLTRSEWVTVHDAFSEQPIISAIEPVPFASEALLKLSESYRLHFATSRLPKAREATVSWLSENGFPDHDLHFLKHGEKHVALGHFDASVEDDADQAEAFAASGFGMNILLAHPWNAESAVGHNLDRVNGWNEVLSILLG